MITQVIEHLVPGWEPPPDTGKTWVRCLCPFHPDSIQSAAVNYRADAFNCLGCGVKGDAIKLLIDQKGIRYAEAHRLAENLSAGSSPAVPHRNPRKPSRRVFETEGIGLALDQGTSQQVHVGVRGRTADWT